MLKKMAACVWNDLLSKLVRLPTYIGQLTSLTLPLDPLTHYCLVEKLNALTLSENFTNYTCYSV